MKNLWPREKHWITRLCGVEMARLGLALWLLAIGLNPIAAQAGPYDPSFNAPRLQAQDFLNLGTPRIALQPDGRILIHGSGFNRFGGIETGSLARFNSDGTFDSNFAFSRDYSMTFSVLPTTNGQLLVNATLASFAGDKETLLRVNADGGLDSSFNSGSGADGNVRAIAIQPDGKVLVGGLFATFNGSPYPYLVRLDTNGNIDPTFGPISLASNAISTLSTGIWSPIVLQPDGKIIVGGVFTAVNGFPRDGLARLNPNGTVDMTFAPTGFSELNGRPVRALGFQSNGMLVVGGRFSLGANTTRRPLVRVDTNGVADAAFVTSFTGPGSWIRDLKILPDDRIVAVDDKVYRFNADGTADGGFVPDLLADKDGFNYAGLVFTVALQTDSKVLFAGMFSFVGSEKRDGVARLNPDGSLDSFDVGRVELDRFPRKVFVQTDGKIYVASDFEQANGALRLGLTRLNRDGTLDQNFDPATALGTNTSVLGAALQPDDKIVIGAAVAQGAPAFLARLNPDGSSDTNFAPVSITDFGDAFALPEGSMLLLAAGNPTLLANHLTLIRRLNNDGSSDNGFQLDSSLDQAVTDPNTLQITALFSPGPKPLLALPAGKLLVASLTTNLQFKLSRLNNDGSVDSGFSAGLIAGAMLVFTNAQVLFDPFGTAYLAPVIEAEALGFLDAAAQADGKLIVVGQFTNYNDSAFNGIVRLNSDGSIDPAFNPGTGPQWVTTFQTTTNLFPRVESVKLTADNKILITGNFEGFSGSPLNGLARLNPNGSVDTNFVAGLTRRNFRLFPRSPASFIVQPDGNYLLTGQFTPAGQPTTVTLSRLLMRPSLRISTVGSGGPFQLNLIGGADQSYAIQASTNLVDWLNLAKIINTNEVNSFLDPATLPRRFYRAAPSP